MKKNFSGAFHFFSAGCIASQCKQASGQAYSRVIQPHQFPCSRRVRVTPSSYCRYPSRIPPISSAPITGECRSIIARAHPSLPSRAFLPDFQSPHRRILPPGAIQSPPWPLRDFEPHLPYLFYHIIYISTCRKLLSGLRRLILSHGGTQRRRQHICRPRTHTASHVPAVTRFVYILFLLDTRGSKRVIDNASVASTHQTRNRT